MATEVFIGSEDIDIAFFHGQIPFTREVVRIAIEAVLRNVPTEPEEIFLIGPNTAEIVASVCEKSILNGLSGSIASDVADHAAKDLDDCIEIEGAKPICTNDQAMDVIEQMVIGRLAA